MRVEHWQFSGSHRGLTGLLRWEQSTWPSISPRKRDPLRGGVAQLGRASACRAEGCGFEPRRHRHVLSGVEQLVAHLVHTQEVGGSNPLAATNLESGGSSEVEQLLDKQPAVGSNPTLPTSSRGPWCNGSIAVSKTAGPGSNPGGPANGLIAYAVQALV